MKGMTKPHVWYFFLKPSLIKRKICFFLGETWAGRQMGRRHLGLFRLKPKQATPITCHLPHKQKTKQVEFLKLFQACSSLPCGLSLQVSLEQSFNLCVWTTSRHLTKQTHCRSAQGICSHAYLLFLGVSVYHSSIDSVYHYQLPCVVYHVYNMLFITILHPFAISGHCLKRQVTRVLLGGFKVILESKIPVKYELKILHRYCACGLFSTCQILMQHLLQIVLFYQINLFGSDFKCSNFKWRPKYQIREMHLFRARFCQK